MNVFLFVVGATHKNVYFLIAGRGEKMALRGILNALGVPDDIGGYGSSQVKAIK